MAVIGGESRHISQAALLEIAVIGWVLDDVFGWRPNVSRLVEFL